MNDNWKTRYARQIALNGWGEDQQRALAAKTVTIVGLGGLGSPAAMYLAASGVGTLILNDFDHVDLSNLSRQPLHDTSNLGQLKTESAVQRLAALNPDVTLKPVTERLDQPGLEALLTTSDCVIDCSDNFGTRFTLNQAALNKRTPLISAAAIREEGQIAVFRHDLDSSPCYRCLYDENDEATGDCQGQGVISPLVGIIGSMAATAALNLLVFNRDNSGQLHCLDAQTLQWRSLTLRKDPRCPACS